MKCPVCNMDVQPNQAAGSAQHNGQTYHFCCAGCKQKFEQAPQRYAQPGQPHKA